MQVSKMDSIGGLFVASDSEVILVSPDTAHEKALESEIDEDQLSLPRRTTGHLSFGLRELESERESTWFVLC